MMQEKYHYKSDWYYIAAFGFVAGSFILPFIIIALSVEMRDYAEIIFIVLFVGWIVGSGGILYLLSHMPASFQADADAVTFSLLFRKITILYSDISSMEVTRYYAKALIRGDVPHYVEELRIVCNGTEHHFHAPMQIDMDDAAMHPERLQEQFENGMFRRLQIYMESRGTRI